ncbi:hypothetical protein GQ457_07G027260 [Hibiscus cannabinus]
MVNPEGSNPEDSTADVSTVARGGDDFTSQMFSNKRVNVCLDDSNFLLWKQQVILTIRGLGLEEFIDPETPKPVKFIVRPTGERVINPVYTQFVKQDSSLASWLLSTVSSDVLPQLVGADTSASIWKVITGLFSKLSTTKVMHLHCKLRSMKKGVMRMREYTVKIKEICDLLALSGHTVSEVEHIATILNGLPPEFAPFVAVITASQVPYSLDGVVSVLVDAESRLMDTFETPVGINFSQYQSDEASGKTEFQSSSNQSRGRGFRSRPYRGGRFRGRSSGRPQCQLCGKIGHLVDTCWYRFDENFKGISSQQTRQTEAPQANACHYQSDTLEPYYEPFTGPAVGTASAPETQHSTEQVQEQHAIRLQSASVPVVSTPRECSNETEVMPAPLIVTEENPNPMVTSEYQAEHQHVDERVGLASQVEHTGPANLEPLNVAATSQSSPMAAVGESVAAEEPLNVAATSQPSPMAAIGESVAAEESLNVAATSQSSPMAAVGESVAAEEPFIYGDNSLQHEENVNIPLHSNGIGSADSFVSIQQEVASDIGELIPVQSDNQPMAQTKSDLITSPELLQHSLLGKEKELH